MYARPVGELARYRRIALGVFCAAMGIACLEVYRHHKLHDVLAEVLAVFALLFWCTLDARIHGKTFHHGWALPFLATWPVTMAFYLVWTRGWRRGSKLYGAAIGVALVVTVILGVTGAFPTHPG
jgi:hypothetical protein